MLPPRLCVVCPVTALNRLRRTSIFAARTAISTGFGMYSSAPSAYPVRTSSACFRAESMTT